jgi:hypothetical protein
MFATARLMATGSADPVGRRHLPPDDTEPGRAGQSLGDRVDPERLEQVPVYTH